MFIYLGFNIQLTHGIVNLCKFVNANNLTTMPKHGIHDYPFSIELVAYVMFGRIRLVAYGISNCLCYV
jgi:hypothetical protein